MIASAGVFKEIMAARASPPRPLVPWCMGLSLVLVLGAPAYARQIVSLDDLSIEELGDIEVTSVSRQAERLADAPASVFVISAEDIRRSGAQSLPEALRLAPNLQVASINAGQYSISSRGFNNTAGNKLSVMVDGRSVYSPLFSGVFWDAQDLPLEDVERIEVVSGPGGTLWGVNAVNGVINVITRSAALTQGVLLSAGASAQESDVTVRQGGQLAGLVDQTGQPLGGAVSYRVYGRYVDRQATRTADGQRVDDASALKRAGFRIDGQGGDESPWTVQGEVYEGRRGQPAPGTLTLSGVARPLNNIDLSGGHLQGRWRHRLAEASSLDVQAYYDRSGRRIPGTFIDNTEAFDLQLNHAWQPAADHAMVWGGEYRRLSNRVQASDFAQFTPARVTQETIALFAQDTATLSDQLALTVGVRLERNDYTGYEVLPNARLAWKAAMDHLVWAAASRTVRAPSRIDRDLLLITPGVLLTGGPDFRSEVAKVFELGYRGQPMRRLSWSATVYRTVYDHLRTYELDTTGALPLVYLSNQMDGSTTGLELWGTWQASERWRLSAGASLLDKHLRLKPGSAGLNGGPAAEGNDPSASWSLRSTYNVSDRLELDAAVRHVARLPQPGVPSYTVLDLRLGFKPGPGLELSLGAKNLLNGRHAEFSDRATRSEFDSQVFVRAVARF